MGFMVRQIAPGVQVREELALSALEAAIPREALAEAAASVGRRRRKLPTAMVLLVCIGMHLFAGQALERVLAELVRGLRLLWPDPDLALATKGAICQARDRVGARPAAALFHRVCRPLATPATRGAFAFGLRLMAIDGTVEDLPDTPANVRAFGRHTSGRGAAAFPQLLGVYLLECGTHAVVDAGFWPCHTGERLGGLRLLRSVGPGMLVLWDRGFHSYAMAERARRQGAHFLGRVPSTATLAPLRRLADGSALAVLRPSDPARFPPDAQVVVRVIAYTLTDPTRPGCGERHRLMTSLLDPVAAPALDLVCGYHERWEVEVAIDELATHQRLAGRPLRSQKPVGVLQELYGLLLAHYAVRVVMHDAALAADLDPDRLSFVHAVQLLAAAVPEFQLVAPAQHPALYQRLLRDLARRPLPPRANRSHPRVVKRKMSKFPRKRDEHQACPQPVLPFRSTVEILI